MYLMFDFYQKRKLRSVVNSRYTQIAIVLLVFAVGWSAYVRYDIAMEMKERRELAEQQVEELQHRKEELAEQVEYLSSDRGIEAEMRRQFDAALPGEKVVVIVEEENNEPVIEPLSGTSTKSERRWYQFWR